jgi:transposase
VAARWLKELGHEVIVADPNFAVMYATRSKRVKTDRRDGRTLAKRAARSAPARSGAKLVLQHLAHGVAGQAV